MSSDSHSQIGGRASKRDPAMGEWTSHFSRTQRAPTVVINPATDTDFEANVKSRLREVRSPESLEDALRPQYPQVAVHPRELSSEPLTIWYVYREGRWVR